MRGFLFILTMISIACTREISITEDEIKPDIFFAEGSFRPFTGKCKIVGRDPELVLHEFSYRRGMLHGKALSWHKNGTLKRKGYYKHGKLSGQWEFWNEKGVKILDANFENDRLEGSYISRDEKGQIREKGIYKANRRVGKWIMEYPFTIPNPGENTIP